MIQIENFRVYNELL